MICTTWYYCNCNPPLLPRDQELSSSCLAAMHLHYKTHIRDHNSFVQALSCLLGSRVQPPPLLANLAASSFGYGLGKWSLSCGWRRYKDLSGFLLLQMVTKYWPFLVLWWDCLAHRFHQHIGTVYENDQSFFYSMRASCILKKLTSSAIAFASASVCDTPIRFLKHSWFIEWHAEQTSLYTWYPRRILGGGRGRLARREQQWCFSLRWGVPPLVIERAERSAVTPGVLGRVKLEVSGREHGEKVAGS